MSVTQGWQNMKIEELGLKIGDAMQLQVGDNSDQRYPVRFYGYNPNGSIIVSAPKSGEDKMFFIREAMLVTLRFMANNVASGFTTRVLGTRGQPYPYLHLEIPKDIQTVEVRKGTRANTNVNATILNKTQKSAAAIGHITTLSCTTVRLQSKNEFADEHNQISVTAMLKFEDTERLVTMDGIVTHFKELQSGEGYVYDLDIKQIDEEDKLMVRFYVYQELLRNLHMI